MTEYAWIEWGEAGVTFGTVDERICSIADCGTRLSRFNDGSTCSLHTGYRFWSRVAIA